MTKPSVYELADKWNRVLVRLSNGRLAGLKNFVHYGDIKYIGVVEKEQWNQDWNLDDENHAHTIDLWNAYDRNSFSHRFDIDAIAFLSNSSEVTDALKFGCDEDIDWDWDINKPQCDDQRDAYEYAIQHLDLAKVPYNREYIIKGDNNNMMNGILSVYEEKQLRKINKKYDDLEQSIKLSDERYKVWLECTTTLDKLYTEDKVITTEHFAPIQLSKDTLTKLHTLYDKREEELCKFHSKIAEVTAQLIMCDTYDQKQEILRRYNVINKNGKVNG